MLGKDGELYPIFKTASSRFGVVKGWLENVDVDGRLHGDMRVVGTPSMRATHSVIANVPKIKSIYGSEMRELFESSEGYTIVGADSAGNQSRGLAHYLNSDEYTDMILNKDVHDYNANNMTMALKDMGFDKVIEREDSKRITYAYMFGAAGKKLWSYIYGVSNKTKGNDFKKRFTAKMPGFTELVRVLESQWVTSKKDNDKYGYIHSITGNRVYAESKHVLLVYLLQACEGITCSSALMFGTRKLQEEGIDYTPLIYYHDEYQLEVKDCDVERTEEIMAWSFREAPKLYGIDIMDGKAMSGKNWKETH